MDKKDIFMVIIVILSLIIMYKIYNGGLVEGNIPEICIGKMDKVCKDERKVGFGTCSGCISPISAQLLGYCKFDNFTEYCKNLPEPPPKPTPPPKPPPSPPPGGKPKCVGMEAGTFCEDEAATAECWPNCPDATKWWEAAVNNCINKYDKTSGKQCVYGWGYNYRKDGTAFGCLSGNSCSRGDETFCDKNPRDRLEVCESTTTREACSTVGAGNCKWTALEAITGNKALTGDKPKCMLKCDACDSVKVPGGCPSVQQDENCSGYKSPDFGNNLLCVSDGNNACTQSLWDDTGDFCALHYNSMYHWMNGGICTKEKNRDYSDDKCYTAGEP